MYDLYLTWPCSTLPDLTALVADIPQANDANWQQRLLASMPRARGFLGLDLPKRSLVRRLLRRVQATGGEGLIVDAAYRQPLISPPQAAELALDAIYDLRDAHFPTYHFHPISFHSEKAMTWTFFSASDQLMAEGHIPGGLFVDIDKIDGHIWQPEEFEQQR